MKEGYEVITPKLAEQYLNRNTNNRPLREGHAEKMAHDMLAKAWTKCTVPIVFYEDKSLADGQHRLWAIVTSGHSQRFYVIHGLPKEDGINIDTGIIRTPVDVARIHNIDPEMTNAIAAIARGIEDGQASNSGPGRSVSEVLVIMAKHREAAHWAFKHGPKGRGMKNAAVHSAMGRAYYVEREKERLAHFGVVVTKGFTETNEDSAAVAMRNYLIMKQQQHISVSKSTMWRDTFIKTQNAIYNFMRHKPLSIIKTIPDESYPLAERVPDLKPETKAGQTRAKQAVLKGKYRKK